MRRKVNEIQDAARVRELLRKCTVGRFATNGADGYPYVVPLNFVYADETIYFHCARSGEKMDNLLRDPKVCFEVDIPLAYLDTGYDPEAPPCQVSQFYYSVIIRGEAEMVEETEEKLAALNCLMATHEKIEGYDRITADMKAVDICAVVAVRIRSMSCKANLAQSKNEVEREKLAAYLETRALPGDAEAAESIRSGR